MYARHQLPDAPFQYILTFVEPRDLRRRVRVLMIPFAEVHVLPNGHEVVNIVGHEADPLFVPPLVQQSRLVVEKLLNLVLDDEPLQRLGGDCTCGHSSHISSAKSCTSMKKIHSSSPTAVYPAGDSR